LLLAGVAGALAQAPAGVLDMGLGHRRRIRQFCTNIADRRATSATCCRSRNWKSCRRTSTAHRHHRQRKAEYEDWLKRRNDFLENSRSRPGRHLQEHAPDAAGRASGTRSDVEIAAAIIMKLIPRQSSLILAEMDATKGRAFANIIASASDPNTSKDPS
jgi:flagellar motility protein MotE (MotC chaperone)